MNEYRIFVTVKTSFIGFHRWFDAPDGVAYLRDWHRHLFGVKATVEVTDPNRQVEFHTLRLEVDKFLEDEFMGKKFEYSCEQLATIIANRFKAYAVTVDEDGENSGTVMAS